MKGQRSVQLASKTASQPRLLQSGCQREDEYKQGNTKNIERYQHLLRSEGHKYTFKYKATNIVALLKPKNIEFCGKNKGKKTKVAAMQNSSKQAPFFSPTKEEQNNKRRNVRRMFISLTLPRGSLNSTHSASQLQVHLNSVI